MNRLGVVVVAHVALFSTFASGLDIQITYETTAAFGFNSTTPRDGTTLGELRRAAFEEAVSTWERQLGGSIPVKVRAQFANLPANELGGNIRLGRHANLGLMVSQTVYVDSLGSQLAGQALSDTEVHPGFQILVEFNEVVDASDPGEGRFYYGLDGIPPEGEFEFLGLALHELGHGLGFLEEIDETTGKYQNVVEYPMIYGRFLVRRGTVDKFFPNMTNSERLAAITSSEVYFAGSNVIAAGVPNPELIPDPNNPPVNQNGEVKIHTPSTFEFGSSVVHWDQSHQIDFLVELLMEPVSPDGHTNLNVDYTREALADLGWVLLSAPQVSINPAEVEFETTSIDSGPSDPMTVTITNTGSADLEIINIELMNIGGQEDASEFQIVSGGEPGTVSMGQDRDIEIVFDPDTAQEFPTLASLMIFTSDTHDYRQRVVLEGQSFGAAGGAAEVWVDAAFAGLEKGTEEAPFDTTVEGTGFALDLGIVHITPGVYVENLLVERPMTLLNDDPLSGIVRIEAPVARTSTED